MYTDDEDVHLTSPTLAQVRQQQIQLHPARLTGDDWQWIRDRRIMVTTPSRTIVDLAVANGERDYVERAAGDAFASGTATPTLVLDALRRHRRRAHRGSIDWFETWLLEQQPTHG